MSRLFYKLHKNGLTEQAANILLSHQIMAVKAWKIANPSLSDFTKYQFYQQFCIDTRKTHAEVAAALGYNHPSIMIETHFHTLPRAYSALPQTFHIPDNAFYMAVQSDYAGRAFVPADADPVDDAEVLRAFQNLVPLKKIPALIMPIENAGIAMPADFDPERHLSSPAPNESPVGMAVFAAAGRSLDIVKEAEAIIIKQDDNDRSAPAVIRQELSAAAGRLQSLTDFPYLHTLHDHKLLVYTYDLGRDWNFTPPDAQPVNMAAYAWLALDDIERKRGGTPPPIPAKLREEIMNGPLRPKSLAEQLQMGLIT